MNSYSGVYDFEKLSPLREPRKKPQTGEKVLLLGTLDLVCVGPNTIPLSLISIQWMACVRGPIIKLPLFKGGTLNEPLFLKRPVQSEAWEVRGGLL